MRGPPPPHPERSPGPLTAGAVSVAATLVMTVSYIDRQALAAIAPTVREALGIDHAHYGLLASAFSMAYLVGAPVAGFFLDRVGARRGLVLFVVAWSAIAGAHALAASFAMLFVLRILLGAAEAPSFPGAAQSIRRILPADQRSAGFGLLFTGSSIGSMIAAPLAVRLQERFDWRVAFLGTAAAGLAWVPLWLLATRGSAVRRALDEGEDRHAAAAPWVDLLSSRAVWRTVVGVLASAPALMFVLAWLPQYFVESMGMRKGDVGRYAWLPPLVFDAGALVFGWLGSRADARALARGEPKPTPTFLLVVAAVMEASLVLLGRTSDPWVATAICGVSMAGGAGIYVLITADMMARVRPTQVSSAGGITAAAQSLVYIVANPLVGKWLDRTHAWDHVTIALGIVAIPGVLVLLSVRPTAAAR